MTKKSKNIAAFVLGAALCACVLFFAGPVLAQNAGEGLGVIGQTTALGQGDVRVIVGRIIQVVLGLVGVVILVYIIYAGFLWMTAGGNEEKVASAKTIIRNAIIGLIIVLSSFSIAQFIISRLIGATGAGSVGSENAIVTTFADFDTGSLGEGIIQAHYPPPGGTDIPRNTKIIVTFKVPMLRESIIGSDNRIHSDNIKIAMSRDVAAGGIDETPANLLITDVMAYTNDDETYVFSPSQYLGSPTEKISYAVYLKGGFDGIQRADGSAAFDGSWSAGYHWEFETSTSIDTVPPKVVSYYPHNDATGVPRNSLIQINFDEAVDPVGSAGDVPPFSNVRVVDASGDTVQGSWQIGNGYKTVEFRSSVLGGVNSCGNSVYILPANQRLAVRADAATALTDPPQADLPYPFDGVTDVAGNSLDGNSDGKSDGPSVDSLDFGFTTSEEIDLTPPRITSTSPSADAGGITPTAPIELNFSKPMALTTLDNRFLLFSGWSSGVSRLQVPLWYYGGGENIGADGTPVSSPEESVVYTRGVIYHQALAPTTGYCASGVRQGKNCSVDSDCGTGTCTLVRFDYYPDATSGITDMNQNCFFPACGSDAANPYCCPSVGGEQTCSEPCSVNESGGLYCAAP